jgi:ATP-binding cassette, subfamily B, bacterial
MTTSEHTPHDADTVDIAPSVAIRTIGRRFWPYARPYRKWLALSLLLVVLVPAIETVKIWMFKLVVDDVLVPKDFGAFPWIAAAFIGLTVVGGAIAAFDDTLSSWVGERFVLAARVDLFRHLHQISLVSLGRRKIGDLISRLTSDITAIEGFVVGGLTDAIAFGAEAAFFTAALFYISWDLALVSLLAAPLFWFAANRFSDLIRDASRERRRRSGTISAIAEESLANAALVQAYHRHDYQAERFRRESQANFTASMRSARLQAVFSPAVEVIELLGALLVIGFGTWKLAHGQITIGGLLVFMTYLTQLYDPIRGLSRLATSLHSAAAGAERVVEILDEPVAVANRPDAERPDQVTGEIRLDNVTFGYDDPASPVLKTASLTIPPGRITALVGPNGAGKSTVARLIVRLHDPDAGQVLLDGRDLRDLDLEWLRDQMAVVLQENLVMDATIRENIAFGRPDASDDEIHAAARRAGADAFIAGLPDGYETQVGSKGSRLSGGQRQRIAIARALVRDAPIVILDEPTNHLDSDGSETLIDAMRELARGRTTLVITHDPAMIAEADEVVVFDRGHIVTPGTTAPESALTVEAL